MVGNQKTNVVQGSQSGGRGSGRGGRGSRGSRGCRGCRGGRGGSNIGFFDPVLQAALTGQDNAAIEKSNAFVLDIVGAMEGNDDESEFDSENEEEGDDQDYTPSSAQSEPPKTSSTNKGSTKATRTKTKHLKNPVQACDIMMKNLELFQRALEAKNNNQFKLTNQNITHMQEGLNDLTEQIQKIQKSLFKTLQNVLEQVNSLVNF